MTNETITDEQRLLHLVLRDSALRGIRVRMVSQWLSTGWAPAWPQLAGLLADLVAAGLGDRELQPLVDFMIDAQELEHDIAAPAPERWPAFPAVLQHRLRTWARRDPSERSLLGAARSAVVEEWIATGRPQSWPQLGALLAELVTAGLGEPELRSMLDFVLAAEAVSSKDGRSPSARRPER